MDKLNNTIISLRSTGTLPTPKPAEGKKPNGFVRRARTVYHAIGFKKGYNFSFFIVTCGTLMGFALAKFQYFDYEGKFLPQTVNGEQYWYHHSSFKRAGIILHLATVLPAAFLVVFQFVPIIRHKAIMFHRINGYVCIVLLLLGNVSAFMIARTAVGGSVMIQTYIGVLGSMVTVALALSYINIKTLQIDQHRAWMLRAWAWASSIITLRLIIGFGIMTIITYAYEFWNAIPCAQLWYTAQYNTGVSDAENPIQFLYPQCQNSTSQAVVAVSTKGDGDANIVSVFHSVFPMAGFVALVIHAILVELYLGLTPAESQRLRMVSYERQVKAGFVHPEKGGLTATRFGDSPAGWNSPLMETTLLERRASDEVAQLFDGSRLDTQAGPHIV